MSLIPKADLDSKRNEINSLLNSISMANFKIEDKSHNIENNWSNNSGKEISAEVRTCINDIEVGLRGINEYLAQLKSLKVSYSLELYNEKVREQYK